MTNLAIRFTQSTALLMLDHTYAHRAFHPYYMPTPLRLTYPLNCGTFVELPFYHDAFVAPKLLYYLVTKLLKLVELVISFQQYKHKAGF